MSFLVQIEMALLNTSIRIRGMLLKFYLILHGCSVGKNLRARRWPCFRIVPLRNISLGDNVTLGTSIIIEVANEGTLVIENNVGLTHNILLSACSAGIIIGEGSGIGENVSIRDSDHEDHRLALNGHRRKKEIVSTKVIIGKNVGIGLGSIIMRGATIKDGVIIGIGSIISRNFRSVENGLYLGNPPRLIGTRK